MDYEALTGAEKAAIVILSLPPETASEFLPQLGDDDVHKVLAAVSRIDEIPPNIQDQVLEEFHGTLGKRDYAVLVLLARLGLRAKEIATLTLDDIDWHSGRLNIRSKGRRRDAMPLLREVVALPH